MKNMSVCWFCQILRVDLSSFTISAAFCSSVFSGAAESKSLTSSNRLQTFNLSPNRNKMKWNIKKLPMNKISESRCCDKEMRVFAADLTDDQPVRTWNLLIWPFWVWNDDGGTSADDSRHKTVSFLILNQKPGFDYLSKLKSKQLSSVIGRLELQHLPEHLWRSSFLSFCPVGQFVLLTALKHGESLWLWVRVWVWFWSGSGTWFCFRWFQIFGSSEHQEDRCWDTCSVSFLQSDTWNVQAQWNQISLWPSVRSDWSIPEYWSIPESEASRCKSQVTPAVFKYVRYVFETTTKHLDHNRSEFYCLF